MGRLGVVALDGVKIGCDASMSANRTEEGLVKAARDEQDRQAAAAAAKRAAREAAAEHAAADAAEDGLFGPDERGDQVPPDAVDPASREARIAAALADLQSEKDAETAAAKAKADAWVATRDARNGRRAGRPPAGNEVAVATARVEKVRAERQAHIADYWARREAAVAAGTRTWGRLPVPETALLRRCEAQLAAAVARTAKRDAATAKQRRVRNITDPESRMMPVAGWRVVAGLQLPGRDQRRRVDHRGECEQQSGRRDHLYRDDRRRGAGRRGDRQPPTHRYHSHHHPRGRR
jgi:hypothetical protein